MPPQPLLEIEQALSSERFTTYLASCGQNRERACVLYLWNLEVGSAFFPWLNMAEVVLRNRIHVALMAIHGTKWPWSEGFERTLPAAAKGYSALESLKKVRNKHQKSGLTGKVVADLNFAFWQHLLTQRYTAPIWNKHLHNAFPNINRQLSVSENIRDLFGSIEKIRDLRNRIAHHEPIFHRDLQADYQNVQRFLLQSQSTEFLHWLRQKSYRVSQREQAEQGDYVIFLLHNRP